MRIDLKDVRHWILECIKRAFIISIPMFFVGMMYVDIVCWDRYKDNLNVIVFSYMILFFYISCAWYIVMPEKKWNRWMLVIILLLVIGMFAFNPKIRQIRQHLRCIETSAPCPEGITLQGG